MDEPLADPSAIALYFVSQTAAKHVKVSLSGEGADEFFGGYNIYREPHDLLPLTRLPRPVRKAMGAVAKKLPKVKGRNYLIRGSKDLQERFIGNAFMFQEEEREKILKSPTGKYHHTVLTRPYYDKVANQDDVTKMQYIDIHFWLIGDILLKADKMCMAHSLELRVPFLDKKVLEFAETVPVDYRIQGTDTKIVMRHAANKTLPDEWANRPKKGFPVPIRYWLREGKYYNIVKEYFTSDYAAVFFKPDALMKLLDDHFHERANNQRKIWTVFTFLVWYKRFFVDEK